jgi:hypothetical protein
MTNETKTYKVYTIVKSEKDGQKDFWQPVGRAYPNKDGSLTVRLNALPTNGQLHIREDKADKEANEETNSDEPEE